MGLSRAHISAKVADPATLLLLDKRRVKNTEYDSALTYKLGVVEYRAAST